MKDKTMKEKFIAFLKKHGAYEKYATNIAGEARLIPSDIDTHVELNIDSIKQIIRNAFFWTDTPEGAEYWENLDDKWRLELKKP